MNPTFSAFKMRELTPDMIKCTDRLINVLEDEQNKEINITEFLKRFTMDTIWNCAFGIDSDILHDPQNEYFTTMEKVFEQEFNMFEFIGGKVMIEKFDFYNFQLHSLFS